MRRLVTTALFAFLVLVAGRQMSLAQDTPVPPPPAPRSETEVEAPKSDPEALELLAQAAARQGGETLAAPESMQSFHVEFRNLKVWTHVRNDDGSWTSANEAVQQLDIDWKRNAGLASSLRTFWELNGRKVWRAVNVQAARTVFWLSDGADVTILSEGTHDADREEVLLHRRLSETLLDVAVLHKMRTDGSVWKRVADDTYEGPALHRTPAPGSSGLTFTIWLDPETKDPRHVRVEPVEADAPEMHYALTYQDDLPANLFSVEGATLRFPRKITVRERYEGIPLREVMEMFVKRVVFNQVDAATFLPKSTLGR